MATLGVQCQNRALGMASTGLFCEGGPIQPPTPVPGLATGGGHGGGSWYWISDLEQPTKRKRVRIKRIEIPPADLDQTQLEQILREDDELLLLVMTLIETGVIE
jgi:hypothetical protein